ncbi:hypothetical protein BRD00_03750 [Halobacteriales archaeon QS_8_69_26]|nr:MAG: hypothetical protein BRD00_03750 [Halobacteriales archaeon QS_8_69_26]
MTLESLVAGGALGLAVFWRVLAVVVYRDAAPESRRAAAVWTVAVLIFGSLGLAAYGIGSWLPDLR